MAITFTVPGDPVPQPRPRITTRGGHGHAYVPASHAIHGYRAAIAAAARAVCEAPLERAPLTMVVDWVFERPKSHFRKDGSLKPDAPLMPRGDNKNLLSGVEDALNKIAYLDDHQIGKHVIERCYGLEARTTVRIS
jgi:Holliday junction resolvase RusA-like endonuclease